MQSHKTSTVRKANAVMNKCVMLTLLFLYTQKHVINKILNLLSSQNEGDDDSIFGSGRASDFIGLLLVAQTLNSG
jgi:hypothetical protein